MARFGLATLNHSPLHGLETRLDEHLETTAAAGFDALAPDVFWLRGLQREGVSLERLARAMSEHGLGCMEIAGLALGDEEQTEAELAEILVQVRALRPELVNTRVVAEVDERLLERLASCTRRLESEGARLALEFSNGTQLRHLAEANELLERSGLTAPGLTLDTWHFLQAEGGPDFDALASLPVERLANVQLSDGVARGPAPYFEETMHRRRMPGDGDLDLRRCAEGLHEKGFDGAIVVEVLSAEWRERPLATFAEAAARSARAWWAD